jgi:Bacterial TSP3 repeat
MKTKWSRLWLLAALLAPGIVELNSARAQVNSWANTGNGTFKWETPGNWSAGAPAAGHSATFITNAVSAPIGDRYRTVLIDSTTASSGTMIVSNLTLSGAGTGLAASHSSLYLNNAGSVTPLTILETLIISPNATVIITNSSLVVSNDVIVDNGLFVDTSTLSMGDCRISSGGNMSLTNSSLSTYLLNITDGKVVLNGGTISVVGPFGGTAVGNSGAGQFTMNDGTVHLESGLVVGISIGTGTVWITGGQLLAETNNASIYLGAEYSMGSLIQSNGTVIAFAEVVGSENVGTLTVAGGTNRATYLLVSQNVEHRLFDPGSQGSAWITGGFVDAGVLALGNNTNSIATTNSIGSLTLSNGVVQAEVAEVAVGALSQGTLTIVGGDCRVYSNIIIGPFDCSGTGVVAVAGGNLFVTNAAGDATLEIRSGTFTLSAGTAIVNRVVLTNACGHFAWTGGVLIYGTAVLDPARDEDGDGIPNGAEQSIGYDPFDSADGLADYDGDGLSNAQEYRAGTNPTNSASALRIISILPQGDDVRIRWTSAGGHTNTVQATDGTAGSFATNFSDLATFVIGGSGDSTNTYIDPFGATNTPSRFYRVRLVP